MKKVRFEEMRPDELLGVMKEEKPVYLPVGSMEWHSVHLGMGVDTVHAENIGIALAEKIGGAVFPGMYIGTESLRSPESLRKLGFDGDEQIAGMDFPGNSLKSCYWPLELFQKIIETQIELLLAMGFRKIVILNGHGAMVQKKILKEISTRYTKDDVRVLSIMVLQPDCGAGLGHAGLAETALMNYLCPESVDISKLPAKKERLYYKDFGIADAGGNEDGEYYVHYDPRDSSEELGRQIFEAEVEKCARYIADALKAD